MLVPKINLKDSLAKHSSAFNYHVTVFAFAITEVLLHCPACYDNIMHKHAIIIIPTVVI